VDWRYESIEKGEPKGTFCESNGLSVDVVDSPLFKSLSKWPTRIQLYFHLSWTNLIGTTYYDYASSFKHLQFVHAESDAFYGNMKSVAYYPTFIVTKCHISQVNLY
jgi:hypothetical protein